MAETSSSSAAYANSLVHLPSELLFEIFVHCKPSDLAALSQSHPILHRHLENSPHLWRQVYHQTWDPYHAESDDQLLALPCPTTRSITRPDAWSTTDSHIGSSAHVKQIPFTNHRNIRAKGKGKAGARNKDEFDFAEQVRRRTWAEKQIGRLTKRPVDMLANYNDTMRALIAVARSRQARPATTDPHDALHLPDLSERHASADYLTDLLTSPSKLGNFRSLIYPRTDVKNLQRWQVRCIAEKRGQAAQRTLAERRKEEKRSRSISTSSNTGTSPKRSRTSGSSNERYAQGSKHHSNKSHAESSIASLATPPRRRSARVQLGGYPPELHDLLYDKQTKNLITLDDGTGLACLEALELLDEQLAAELHVLHGVHPGYVEVKDNGTAAATRGVQEPQRQSMADEDEDEDDSLFVDPGTPSESQDSSLVDHETPSESQDDNLAEGLLDILNPLLQDELRQPGEQIRLTYADEFDLHRHHREPALGSEFGHEGNARLRARAREIVYDTARFGPENSFGPLRAWREHYAPLDGLRFLAQDEVDENGENQGEEDEQDIGFGEDDPEVIELQESSDDGDEEGSRGDENDIQFDERHIEEGQAHNDDVAAEDASDDDDEDFDDEDFDDDDEDDDDSITAQIFRDIREMAISHSRGVIPYYEAKQRKAQAHATGQAQAAKSTSQDQTTAGEANTSRLQDVWRTDKKVDWILVEAIMVVMYCNIRHAVSSHDWGLAFRLPNTVHSLVGRDQYARNVHASDVTSAGAWRDLLGLPCGWSHSRGSHDSRSSAPKQEQEQEQEQSAPEATTTKSGDEKPYDWAGIESVWIGTYAFLDWTKWASFNARDPLSRGLLDPTENSNANPLPINTPSLESEREALGDCLQLRMELLPLKDQKPRNEADRMVSYLEGHDVAHVDAENDGDVGPSTCQVHQATVGKYPPLRFRGSTRTFLEGGDPIPRGELYGIVRPVFADKEEEEGPGISSFESERAIVAIHWDITHRYDGEDAWSLSGIQAGPPGTRAPIYGIWGAAQRDNLSPCGPWTYYKVDERRWQDVEAELLREAPRSQGRV